MKKLIAAIALVVSVVAFGSVDTYKFTSKMHTYSLTKQAYVTTSFNGTMVVDDGDIMVVAYKKDTKETIELTSDSGSTNSTDEVSGAIITGKKNKVGANMFALEDDDSILKLVFSGNGAAKTTIVGCGPCGESSACTKIKTLSGAFVGSYDCGCANGQHFEYAYDCELPDSKEITRSPVWGTWKATLKSSIED